jgi:hypothetical protein
MKFNKRNLKNSNILRNIMKKKDRVKSKHIIGKQVVIIINHKKL